MKAPSTAVDRLAMRIRELPARSDGLSPDWETARHFSFEGGRLGSGYSCKELPLQPCVFELRGLRHLSWCVFSPRCRAPVASARGTSPLRAMRRARFPFDEFALIWAWLAWTFFLGSHCNSRSVSPSRCLPLSQSVPSFALCLLLFLRGLSEPIPGPRRCFGWLTPLSDRAPPL